MRREFFGLLATQAGNCIGKFCKKGTGAVVELKPLGGLRYVNRTLLVLFLFTPIVFSQPRLEMGVRIDAPLVGPLTTYSYPELCATGAQCGYYQSAPLHPAIGLSASIPIAPRLRIRFDPVYQRVGISAASYIDVYQYGVNSPLGEAVGKTSSTANRWQFPALVEAEPLRHFRFCMGPAVPHGHGRHGQACRSVLRNFYLRGQLLLSRLPPSDRGSSRRAGIPVPLWKRDGRSRAAIRALVR